MTLLVTYIELMAICGASVEKDKEKKGINEVNFRSSELQNINQLDSVTYNVCTILPQVVHS